MTSQYNICFNCQYNIIAVTNFCTHTVSNVDCVAASLCMILNIVTPSEKEIRK